MPSALTAVRRRLPIWLVFATAGLLRPPLSLAQGPYTEAGISKDSISIQGWATSVVNLTRGPQNISVVGSPLASFGTASAALGKADNTVVSLGDRGSITLSFAAPIANGSGADFAVFENGFASGGGIYAELGHVEVSSDGVNFVRFPSVSLTQTATQVGSFATIDPTDIKNLAGKHVVGFGTPFDLNDLAGNPLLDINAITQVRVIDVVGSIDPLYGSRDSLGNYINDPYTTAFASGGFDFDAVGVINYAPVPEPSSLLIFGVGSLAILRTVSKRFWPVRSSDPAVRQGFTLIELLVVIAIVALLVGLLLPAVQKVREAGARLRCTNNLKQIGLALHAHHESANAFPRGGYFPVTPNATNPKVLSWGASILPWLEQDNLFQTINPELAYTDPQNQAAGSTVLQVYLCPTAHGLQPMRQASDLPYTSTVRYARNDYGAINGERGLRAVNAANSPERGVLIIASTLGIKDILDGTSQTILVSEAPEGINGLWISPRNLFDQSAPISMKRSDDSPYTSCQLPGIFCDFGQEMSSYHFGGANGLFADGSVRFVRDSTSNDVVAAICSRAGGEVLADPL